MTSEQRRRLEQAVLEIEKVRDELAQQMAAREQTPRAFATDAVLIEFGGLEAALAALEKV